MSHSDTCNLTIRLHASHHAAAVAAFGAEPSGRYDLPDGRLCVLLFDGVRPHAALDELARQRITFDGSHNDGAAYPGRFFAAHRGDLAAVARPFCKLTVPIDLDSLAVDEAALCGLRAYQRLSDEAQEAFYPPSPLDVPLAACHLEEVGDEEPWHRLLGSLSLAGLRCHVEAIAVQYMPINDPVQEAAACDLASAFRLVADGFGTDRGFQTLSLQASDGQDHDYAVFVYPYDR